MNLMKKKIIIWCLVAVAIWLVVALHTDDKNKAAEAYQKELQYQQEKQSILKELEYTDQMIVKRRDIKNKEACKLRQYIGCEGFDSDLSKSSKLPSTE